MPMTQSQQESVERWMFVGIRVAALEVADADAAPTLHIGATVVEVLPDGVRVLADDDSTGILRYETDDFGMLIGPEQDELPHGYVLVSTVHVKWQPGCPFCWSAARTAAAEAHARDQDEGYFAFPDGHGASVRRA